MPTVITAKKTKKKIKPPSIARARFSPLGFGQYVYPERETEGEAFSYRAHKTNVLIDKLIMHKLLNDDDPVQTVVINQPPRTGKSLYLSRLFPAWYKGKFKDRNLLSTGYSSNLTADFTLSARELIKSHGEAVFGVRVDQNLRKKDNWQLEDGGQVMSASMRGQITGYGFNHVTIDDPYSNYEDAHSETIRRKVWNEIGSTIDTRMEGLHPTQILCQTRWHSDDAAGRYLAMEENGDESIFGLNLPAIAEEDMYDWEEKPIAKKGELLFPWQWNEKKLEGWRKKHGEYMYSALFQGKPTTPVGTFWEEDLFTKALFYEWPKENRYFVIAIDPAHGAKVTKGCDAALVAGSTDTGQNYFIEADLQRAGPLETVQNLESFIDRLPRVPDAIAVEENGMQTEISVRIDNMSRRRGWKIKIFAVPLKRDLGPILGTSVNKDSRIQSMDPYFREHQLKFKGKSPMTSKLVQQAKMYGSEKNGLVDGLDGLEILLEFYSHMWQGFIKL